jgi:hypothetical protein
MSKEKLPALMFYPGDWLRDDVATCSLAAQGLWLRMMIKAHESKQYGYLSQQGEPIPAESIARACGTSEPEYSTLLAELDRAGVPSRTPNGIIYSRRMVRDAKTRAMRQKVGKLGGNPKLCKSVLVNHKDNQPLNLNTENEDEFLIFYSKYPRKKSRGQAERAFKAARKHAELSEIMAGLDRYLAEIQRNGTALTFVKYPAPWLNGKCWEDESDDAQKQQRQVDREIKRRTIEAKQWLELNGHGGEVPV